MSHSQCTKERCVYAEFRQPPSPQHSVWVEQSNHCLLFSSSAFSRRWWRSLRVWWLSCEHRASFSWIWRPVASLIFVDRAPEILAGGVGGGTSASSRRCPVPPSLSVHPRTVPPCSLPPRSWTWNVMGGRQPRQWERSHVASLCWKSSLPIMAPRLPAPVGVPMGGTEMMQSWCLEWEKGRAPGLSHPCGWLASGLGLEPAGGPHAHYQWSQRLLTPDPAGQSDGSLCRGELPAFHTLHGSEV